MREEKIKIKRKILLLLKKKIPTHFMSRMFPGEYCTNSVLIPNPHCTHLYFISSPPAPHWEAFPPNSFPSLSRRLNTGLKAKTLKLSKSKKSPKSRSVHVSFTSWAQWKRNFFFIFFKAHNFHFSIIKTRIRDLVYITKLNWLVNQI